MSVKNFLKDERCSCSDTATSMRAALLGVELEPCELHGPGPATPATGPLDLGDGQETHARALLGATTRSAATRTMFLEALNANPGGENQ